MIHAKRLALPLLCCLATACATGMPDASRDPAAAVRWVGRAQNQGMHLVDDEAQAVPLTAVQADAFINKLRASTAGRQWRAELVPHAPTPTDPKNTTGA